MDKNSNTLTLQDRKMQLILDGETYRMKVLYSQAMVTRSLHGPSLLRSSVEHILGVNVSRWGGRLRSVFPYLLNGYTYLSRKKLLKPSLITGLVVVAGLAFALRKR